MPAPRRGHRSSLARAPRPLAALILSLSAAAALALAAPAPAATPWLHTRERSFVDAHGRRVLLRGVDSAATDSRVLAAVVATGANFVRLPVYWEKIEPARPSRGRHHWNESALRALDRAVGYYRDHRVYVLVDFHQWYWSSYFRSKRHGHRGIGMPHWLYARRLPATTHGRELAETGFYRSGKTLAHYRAFVRMMVRRYNAYPNVIGYEILNEPPNGTLPNAHGSTQLVLHWEARIRATISRLARRRTVFFMLRRGADLGIKQADLSAFGSLRGLALDLHDYSGGTGGNYSADGESVGRGKTFVLEQHSYHGTLRSQLHALGPALERTREWRIPLIVGEWGAQRTNRRIGVYQRQLLEAFGRCGIGWARWEIGPHTRLSLLSRRGSLNVAGKQIARALHHRARTTPRTTCAE